jgi:sialidase-1
MPASSSAPSTGPAAPEGSLTLRVTGSGLVYRNPRPEVRAVNAWHPSLVELSDGRLLCSFDLGQAPESHDYNTYLSWSVDNAATWSEPQPLVTPTTTGRAFTYTLRAGLLRDGTVTAFGARHIRDDPRAGLINHPSLGFTPMELVLSRSADGGHVWTPLETIVPPLQGPAFEICHRLMELQDGRWLVPTSTWPGWDGDAPDGMKAIALVSYDQGRSWPEWLRVFDGWDDGVANWEQSIAELPDGRLIALSWRLEVASGRTLPTAFSISDDGRTFEPPRPTGLLGQTAKVAVLDDGRLIAVYRRNGTGGIWACLAALDGEQWAIEEDSCVWAGQASGTSPERSVGEDLSALKCGYPTIVAGRGSALVAFWCCEDCVFVIRWVRLDLSRTPGSVGSGEH